MAETELTTPIGRVDLRRGDTPDSSPLRAWSAADRLLLDELFSQVVSPRELLIVNDPWGALTVPFVLSQVAAAPDQVPTRVTTWNDSALARASTDANLGRNGLAPGDSLIHLPGDRWPEVTPDLVLVTVPKSHRLLAWQLAGVAQARGPRTQVIVGGMSRHLTSGVVELIASALGGADPRRAVGKARLIDVPRRPADERSALDDPLRDPVTPAFTTEEGVAVHEAPGVFSAGHLDVGTRLLLDTLDGPDLRRRLARADRVVDLGCGNGVIAATLGRRHDAISIDAVDASDLAIAAARSTWAANGLAAGRARFEAADGLPSELGPYDLVVTNPPFHQDHALDRDLTDRLLAGAAANLAPDGALVVVAQRHLELHRGLRRHFTETRAVSRHPSHVVLVATGPRDRLAR